MGGCGVDTQQRNQQKRFFGSACRTKQGVAILLYLQLRRNSAFEGMVRRDHGTNYTLTQCGTFGPSCVSAPGCLLLKQWEGVHDPRTWRSSLAQWRESGTSRRRRAAHRSRPQRHSQEVRAEASKVGSHTQTPRTPLLHSRAFCA